MLKLMAAVLMTSAITACAFDPVQYEQNRKAENQLHNRTMG
ncbi:MAG: hypothetical protein ACN6NX_11870 [Acinetobacter sp.]